MTVSSRDRLRSHPQHSPDGTTRAAVTGISAGQFASAVWDRLGLEPGTSVAHTITALNARLVAARARTRRASAARAARAAETADEALYRRVFGTGV